MRSSASVSSLSMSKSQPIVSRGGMIPMHALTNKRTNTHTHSQYYNHRSHGDTDRFGNTYTHGHSHARIPLHGGAAESADPWSRDVQWFRSLSVSDRRKMKMKIKSLESQRRKGTESAGSKTRGSPAKERKPTHAYVDASGQRVDRSSEAFVEEYLSQHPLLQQLAERYIDPPSSTQDTHATGGDGRDGAGGPANDKSSNAMSKNWKSDGGFIVRSGVEGRAAAASPSLPPITSSSSSGQHTRGGTQGGPQKRGLGRAGRGRGTANNGKQNGGGQARERTRGQGGKQDSFARAKISDVTADIFFAALKDIQTDSASRRKLLELERIGITDSKDERNRRLVYYIVKELDNETKLMFVENVNKLRARAQKRGQGAGKAMGDVCFQSLMRKAEEQRILMPKPVRKKRIQKIARYDSMDSSWKKNRKAVNAATDAMGKASMLNDISGMRNILEDEPTHARGEHTTDTASKIMADIMAVKALKSQGVIVDEQDEERERRWREEAMLKIDTERNKPEVRSSFRKEKMEEIRKSLAGKAISCVDGKIPACLHIHGWKIKVDR